MFYIIQHTAAPSTIDASIICPLLDFSLSNRAIAMPIAQSKPPPAKSASKFCGGSGAFSRLPSNERSPENKDNVRKYLEYK